MNKCLFLPGKSIHSSCMIVVLVVGSPVCLTINCISREVEVNNIAIERDAVTNVLSSRWNWHLAMSLIESVKFYEM